MEDDNNSACIPQNSEVSSSQNEVSETETKSAEDIVNEMIKKASLADGSSDEEYISAEEEDEADESYVINSVNENSEVHQENCSESLETSDRNREHVEDAEKVEELVDEMEERRKAEESLTEDERMERREQSQVHKNNGNTEFRSGNYSEASLEYSKALDICPLNFHRERSIMFANRAACKMKQDAFEDAIKDSTHAIDLHPQYIKAILRRAELYEKTEKLDDALKDYETVITLDSSQHAARASCMRLQEQIKERNEKLKTEMMGKLKDLGNLVLRPFGLSTNNFKLQQDPGTGSYSMQFQQSPTGNGS